MTTFVTDFIRYTQNRQDIDVGAHGPVGGTASLTPTSQKSYLSSTLSDVDTPRGLHVERSYIEYAKNIGAIFCLPSSQGLGQFLQSSKDTGTPAASRAP